MRMLAAMPRIRTTEANDKEDKPYSWGKFDTNQYRVFCSDNS